MGITNYYRGLSEDDEEKKKREEAERTKQQQESVKLGGSGISSYYKKMTDESRQTAKTPSQAAAQQVKEEEKDKTIFQKVGEGVSGIIKKIGGNKEEDQEEKKPILQQAKEFFTGEENKIRSEDDPLYVFMTGAYKTKEEITNLRNQTKQEIINFYKENLAPDSKYRATVNQLTVDNFDTYRDQIQGITDKDKTQEAQAAIQMGQDLFDRKLGEALKTGKSQEYMKNPELFFTEEEKKVWQDKKKYEREFGTWSDWEDQLKALDYAEKDVDEFLGYESSNKGIVKRFVENIKDWEYTTHPFSSNRYKEKTAVKEREAVEKWQNNQELTTEEQTYLKAFQAKTFNGFVERGLGDMAADIMTGSISFGSQMAFGASMPGRANISTVTAPTLANVTPSLAKTITEKVLANSVQLALDSNYNVPYMDARTAEYMLPTVDYEEWINDTKREDLLNYVKKGDDEDKAQGKAYASNLVEYVSEGVGRYIDDAMPFVKKAFIGKFLRNSSVTTPSVARNLLSQFYINGIVGEVIEEEVAEPFQAAIDKREYYAPFFTPEGRERLLVETLGILPFQGIAAVSDVTQNRIVERRAIHDAKVQLNVARQVEEKPETPTTPTITPTRKAEGVAQAGGFKTVTDLLTGEGGIETSLVPQAGIPDKMFIKEGDYIPSVKPGRLNDIAAKITTFANNEQLGQQFIEEANKQQFPTVDSLRQFANSFVQNNLSQQVATGQEAVTTTNVETKIKPTPLGDIISDGRQSIKVDQTKYPGLTQFTAGVKNGVGNMFVEFSKGNQGKGLGTKLVQEVESKMIEAGAKEVVIDSYNESIGFWKKQGYEKVADTKYKNKTGLTRMSKTLTSKAQNAEADEVKRVAGNILKNNTGITKVDAEAMARDLIENKKYAVDTKAPKPENVKAEIKEEKPTGLVLKPSQAKEGKETIEEAKKLGLEPRKVLRRSTTKTEIKDVVSDSDGIGNMQYQGKYNRPSIGKSELKTILQSSKEFSDNPTLTVDQDKNLVFDGKKIQFTITPEAMQLSKDNITVGDSIKVDQKLLSGSDQLRVMKGEETYAFDITKVKDLGARPTTGKVFSERFEVSSENLEKLPGGTGRDTYILSDTLVAKVAKSPRGLVENSYENDYVLDEFRPKVIEEGEDYVIVERAERNDSEVAKYLKPLKKFTAVDFDNKTAELQEAMVEMGLDVFLNYDLLWNDFIAPRNWGIINGKPILIDGGALNRNLSLSYKPEQYEIQEWNRILDTRKQANRQYKYSGGLYPPEIYKAINDYLGYKNKIADVDRWSPEEVRRLSYMGLKGGMEQFDSLVGKDFGKEKNTGEELAFDITKVRQESPEFTKETDKIVKRSAIAKELEAKLNVAIRRGKFRSSIFGRQRAGIYKGGREIIRYRSGGLQTIMHEVTHFIQEKVPEFSKKSISSYKAELVAVSQYTGYGENTPGVEGFAEFGRLYFNSPTKAKEIAPTFYAYFEESLLKYPEMNEVLQKAKKEIQLWKEMPATSKVMSQISFMEDKPTFMEQVKGKYESLYSDTIDNLNAIGKFVGVAKKQGAIIPEEENPYVLARNSRGWVGKADVFLNQGTFGKQYYTMENGKAKVNFKGKSFKEILKPIDRADATTEFSTYLVAQRALELSRRGKKTGIDTIDAVQAVAELEKKYPIFKSAAKELYAYQDQLLQYGYENGLYDSKLLAKLRNMSNNYVPFYRVFEELQSQGHMGKGYANVQSPIKRMKGSDRDIVNPLESIIKNTYTILYSAERNNVGIAMAEVAKRSVEAGKMFEKVDPPSSKVASIKVDEILKSAFGEHNPVLNEIYEIIGNTDEDLEAVVNIYRPSMFTYKDNTITILRDGKKEHYEVSPDLYKAMLAMNEEDVSMVLKIASLPARWLRAGATLAPEFMVRNPARDQWSAFVYSRYGFIPIVDLARGVFSLVKRDNAYTLWKLGGGERAMMVSMDRQYLSETFDEIVKGKKFTHYLKNPLEAFQIVSELGEIGTRLGEAKKAISKGANPVEAAYASREVTLDFARIGAKTRAVNAIIAFWNANVQGTDKMIREFKTHPVRTTTKVMLGITMPSILLYFANRGDDRWKEIPQWQKDLFWIIFVGDKIIRIPKPFELGIIFGSVPERILEYIDTKDEDLFNTLLESIGNGASPGFIPTGLLPILENITNYSFFRNAPIVPQRLENLPPEEQYSESTSETAKKIGALLNAPPMKVDNIFYGYTGGLGRHLITAVDGIMKGTGIVPNITEPSPTAADLPVVKAFVVREPKGSAGESVNKFYDKLEELESYEQAIKKSIEAGETKKAEEYRNKHPEVLFQYDYKTNDFYSASARYFRDNAKKLSELSELKRTVYRDRNLSAETKRKKIDEIEWLQTKYAQEALKYYDQITGEEK